MSGPIPFALGLLVGVITVFILIRFTRREGSRRAEQVIAPQVLDLELKRAERIGYSITFLLFRPKIKQLREFLKWIEESVKKLRIREYDLVLRWSDEEILVILPGSGEDDTAAELERRFHSLLHSAGWVDTDFSIVVCPKDGTSADSLLFKARESYKKPGSTE